MIARLQGGDLKRRNYHIDAEDIANSTRSLVDAADILARERPDMICGRGCMPLAAIAALTSNPARKCPGLQFQNRPQSSCPVDDSPPKLATNVWVNGRRIRMMPPNEMSLARQTGMLAGLLPGTMAVLGEIRAEHISEITYVDELDKSVGKIGSEGALFIVLKEGIAYDPGSESHLVVDRPPPARAAASARAALPGYRYRLLGVFDQLTGDPIVGAEVMDMKTGTKALTTKTGTVSLIFLPEGGTPVRITKPGYEELTLAVEISAESAEPLTLLMVRKP
jgi:hypothetical protein